MATRFREFQSNKVLSVAGERTSFKMRDMILPRISVAFRSAKGAPFAERKATFLIQGLTQILLQIGRVFDAHAQAHEAVVNAPRLPDLRRNTGVRHGRWVADERLDTA